MTLGVSRRLLLSGSILAVAATAPALAQNQPTNPEAPVAGEQHQGALPRLGDPIANATELPREPASAADIVVTARRIQERLEDVPISITVFNQGELNNRNVVSGQDLATYTPSLTANARFGQNNASFAIRGFTQELRTQPSVGVYFNEVVSPRAGLTGNYFGEGAGPGLFFDLQSVQVLKGPQGTLFGRNTTGGAILLVPQRPTGQFGGYVEGTLGNFDERRLQGVLNLPINDSIKLRLGADWEKRDGYLKNISGIGPDRFGDRNRYALRGGLLLNLTPSLENYTVAYYQRSHTNGTIPTLTECNNSILFNGRIPFLGNVSCQQIARQAGRGFYTVQNAIPNAGEYLRQWQVSNTTKWDVSDSLTLRNIASYGEFYTQQKQSLFGEYFPQAALGGTPLFFTWSYPANAPTGAGGLGYGGKLLPRANQWTASEEFQIVGTLPKLQYQAGVYYERSKSIGQSGANSASFTACPGNPPALETGQCIAAVPGASATYSPAINTSRFTDVGTYAQATYSIFDKLKLTGGIRYTWDHIEGSTLAVVERAPNAPFFCTFAPLVGPLNDAGTAGRSISNIEQCRISRSTKSSAPTWVADLEYTPIEDLLVYAKYSRGYKSGTVNIFAAPVAPFDVIKPEKVDVYEVGLKTSWRGSTPGTFNIAGFYNSFTNQQILLGLEDRPGITPGFLLGNRATSTATVVNVGKSRIQGFEADGSIRLFRLLNLSASGAYLDTKVKRLVFPTIPAAVPYNTLVPTVFPGSQLPFTPKWKVTATAAFDLPVPDDLGKMTASATISYSARLLNQAGQPGVGVQRGNGVLVDNIYLPKFTLWNFDFNWRNVLKLPVDLAVFVVNATDKKYYLSYNNRNSVGFASQIAAEPRTFGVRLRYRFGK